MKRWSAPRRPWWSVDDAASYLGIGTADLRELGAVGIGPKYTEDAEAVRHYRPADVRLWASTGLVRDGRGWNAEAR
ncbi:hypothetical protein [Kitasatospora sp. NPDC087314]|uniref:hypothetical protein n=1 Tax=Kitasatospora sp. NPDC087314 TaxID=3364068 RepID=UPI0037F94760